MRNFIIVTLLAFTVVYEVTPLLFYHGSHRLLRNDILFLPVEEFLLRLDPLKENLID